jgi:hypothetical protein
MYNIYAVQVSNAYGSATSANAILTVIPLSTPTDQLQNQTARLRFTGVPSGAGHSQMQLEFLGAPNRVYALQASATLRDWVTIGICATDANGSLTITDPDADKYPARLYRVVGQ